MHDVPFRRRFGVVAAVMAFALAAGLLAPGRAMAIRAIQVTTTADELQAGDGELSLREAFAAANASDEEADIVLAAGQSYNLTLCRPGDDDNNAVGDLDHYGNGLLTVSGNRSTIRQTCDGARVIDQRGSGLLNLADMTITGGNAATAPGGGVFAEGGGELDLKNDVIENNHSGAAGGGVAALGPTVITGTTMTFNRADELAGAIAGIGPLTVVKSTITGNQSKKIIGGIAASAGLDLVYSTVQDNSSVNVDVQAGGLTAFGSVIGIPQKGKGRSCSIEHGGTRSLGYNFANDGSCGFGGGAGDTRSGGDPKLRPQRGSSGVVNIVPQPGSKLIDAIPRSSCNPSSVASKLPSYAQISSDQVGTTRPQGRGCDIGAIEVVRGGRVTKGLTLAGGAGRDVIRGTRLADRLFGLDGRDALTGEAGNDMLDGGPGDDVIAGDAGRDVLVGGLGRDRIYGGSGDDRIYAVDGERDRVSCGSGRDVVYADRFDVLSGCERRH